MSSLLLIWEGYPFSFALEDRQGSSNKSGKFTPPRIINKLGHLQYIFKLMLLSIDFEPSCCDSVWGRLAEKCELTSSAMLQISSFRLVPVALSKGHNKLLSWRQINVTEKAEIDAQDGWSCRNPKCLLWVLLCHLWGSHLARQHRSPTTQPDDTMLGVETLENRRGSQDLPCRSAAAGFMASTYALPDEESPCLPMEWCKAI